MNWPCVHCGQNLGVIAAGHIIIVHAKREIVIAGTIGIEQTCHKCGTLNPVPAPGTSTAMAWMNTKMSA